MDEKWQKMPISNSDFYASSRPKKILFHFSQLSSNVAGVL